MKLPDGLDPVTGTVALPISVQQEQTRCGGGNVTKYIHSSTVLNNLGVLSDCICVIKTTHVFWIPTVKT